MDEPLDVLTEKRADIINKLLPLIGFAVVGVVLLAIPGPYLDPSSTRIAGVLSLVVVASAIPPQLYRARHGAYRLELYEDRFWFGSRYGDGTVPWTTCGQFSTYVRPSSSPLIRRRSASGVMFDGMVERIAADTPWRSRRSGGTGWEHVVLPSRYGMDAVSLVAILNSHRDAALARTLPPAPGASSPPTWDQQRPWNTPVRRRSGAWVLRLVPGLLLIALLAYYVEKDRPRPVASQCTPAYTSLRDATDHLQRAITLSGPDQVDANAIAADASAIGTAGTTATGSLRSQLSLVDADLAAVASDVRSGDLATEASHLDAFSEDLRVLNPLCGREAS